MDLPSIELWINGKAVPLPGDVRELRVDSSWRGDYRGTRRRIDVTLEFEAPSWLLEFGAVASLEYIIVKEPGNAPLVVEVGPPNVSIGRPVVYRLEGHASNRDPNNPAMQYVRSTLLT